MSGFFPDNSHVRRVANAALAAMGVRSGLAKIRENKRARRPAWDVLHKADGAARGRVLFTVTL